MPATSPPILVFCRSIATATDAHPALFPPERHGLRVEEEIGSWVAWKAMAGGAPLFMWLQWWPAARRVGLNPSVASAP